jgi:rSAM/selenodomain-associated transferase 2
VGEVGVSVVIPALDEEDGIAAAVASVAAADEVIVVDGGSRDGTVAAARAAGAQVMAAPAGRGGQMDVGARKSRGEWIVFLHADTRLEPGWRDALLATPADRVGGAFRFAVDSPRAGFRAVERAVALRCRLFSLPYGDQALFVRRAVYAQVGGFPPYPLMEDVAFVRRLKRAGPLALLRPRALTSPRRWERHGIAGTTARNLWLLAQYAAGRPPETLARRYGRGAPIHAEAP